MGDNLPPQSPSGQPGNRSLFDLEKEKGTSRIKPSFPIPEPKIEVSINEVLQALKIHKGFRLPLHAADVTVDDLPTFDDLTPYGITDSDQETLWKHEVERLYWAVSGTTSGLFKGSTDFAVDSKKAHELLAAVADRVFQAMTIADYDAESMLAKEKDTYKVEKLHKKRAELEFMVHREENGTSEQDADAPHPKDEDIHDFIDYFSSVVARVLCTAADGGFMHIYTLAHMAKLCTKIKVLTTNLPEFAQTSINNGVSERKIPEPLQHGLRGPQNADNANNQGDQAPIAVSTAASGPSKDLKPFLEDLRQITGIGGPRPDKTSTRTKKDILRTVYFPYCQIFRRGVLRLFRVLLLSMRGSYSLTSTSLDSYELSSIVYVAGFERFRVLMYQDHHEKSFIGSSGPDEVNYARIVYHLLDNTLRSLVGVGDGCSSSAAAISSRNTDSEVNNAAASVGTAVSWTYVPAESEGLEILRAPEIRRLESMSDVITIIVPLILTHPASAGIIDTTVSHIAFAEDVFDRDQATVKLRKFGKYTAFCSLRTKEYEKKQRSFGTVPPRSLSQSLTRLNNLLCGPTAMRFKSTTSFPLSSAADDPDQRQISRHDSKETFEQVERHYLELNKARKKMKSWVLEEKGVVVRCKLFVWTLIVICALLASGGVAVGFTVGQGIPGVDPFNIATYCWVLAAFVLLIARSFRVRDWPWNDFLHGRVVCKSVSELSSITSIDDQFIIAKLLQEERESILQTRGPFNTIFRRESENGFSIDRPITPWTMMISGLIMIEVESFTGHALICLDLRQDVPYAEIEHEHVPSEKNKEKYIFCSRLNQDDGEDTSHAPRRIRLRKGKGPIWLRTLGLYGNENVMFV